MKITKAQLKQIIQEELSSINEGDEWYSKKHETAADEKYASRDPAYGLRPDQEARYEMEAADEKMILPIATLYDKYKDDLDMVAFSEEVRRQFKTGGNPFGDLGFKAVIAIAHAYYGVRRPEDLFTKKMAHRGDVQAIGE